jgi:hypothetical protein
MSKLLFCLLFFISVDVASLTATQYTFDKNEDGKPDQWYDYEDGKVITEQSDANFDGKVDYKAEFDRTGRKRLEEFDMNFDGKMDDIYHYDEGMLITEELDTNFDGKIDIRIHLVEGNRVSKYEQDTDFDGVMDKVKEFGKK